MKKQFVQRLMSLAVVAMASMSCFAQGKGGEATGWTASKFGPDYQELSYSVTTNTIYHEAVVTGFASYVVETPAIMDDPETYAPGDDNLQIEKNTIIINHYLQGGTSHDVYIPSVAANAFAEVDATLASKITAIKIDFKENSESEDYTQNKPVVIGSKAFAGLTSVANVYSFTPGEFVKAIPTDAFASKVFKKATLVIPEGSFESYTSTDGWSKFYNIKAGSILLGDADGSGSFDLMDLLYISSAVKSKDWSEVNIDAVDIDGNGKGSLLEYLTLSSRYRELK